MGRGPARNGRSRTRHSPTGRSPGVAASPSPTTSEITRRRSRAGGSSTSHRAPGLVAIAAMNAGASAVTASDIDPFAVGRDRPQRTGQPPSDHGPARATSSTSRHRTWTSSSRATAGTRRASPSVSCRGSSASALPGSTILVGDPGRRYLPAAALEEIATYEVRTTTELEDLALKTGHVYTVRDQ